MTRVYRILRKRFAVDPLNGEGSYRFGGRWSSPGTRLAYTAEHLSLAIIEYFVHISADDPPKDLVVVTAGIPDSVSREILLAKHLPANWQRSPAHPALAAIGDDFARRQQAAVLVIPSALAPSESNWLINPLHPHFADIEVYPPEPFQYDPRFFD